MSASSVSTLLQGLVWLSDWISSFRLASSSIVTNGPQMTSYLGLLPDLLPEPDEKKHGGTVNPSVVWSKYGRDQYRGSQS
ncbi:unnamed protein product [Protopolystoma xenopodis]|uniref:Uncharacterized protein n=1 Tax=Protopolystoma xenopodis TaxID=117903 RepID=A0A3S5A4P9_9PLAT|nr:unnamed protein product [Protopolystoma xenopodis]